MPSSLTSWMSKSLIAATPGGEPSNATQVPSGDRRARFAFWFVWRIRCRPEPSGRIDQIDGIGDIDQ